MIGSVATLDSSSVMWPSKPASTKPAVEWISRPEAAEAGLALDAPDEVVGDADALERGAEHELAGVEHEHAVVGDGDQLGEVLQVLLHVDHAAVWLRNTRNRLPTFRSIDDGWMHDSSSGSMTMRPAAIASRMAAVGEDHGRSTLPDRGVPLPRHRGTSPPFLRV